VPTGDPTPPTIVWKAAACVRLTKERKMTGINKLTKKKKIKRAKGCGGGGGGVSGLLRAESAGVPG